MKQINPAYCFSIFGIESRLANHGLAERDQICILGANWSRSANFLLRPEMRWDWFEGVGTPYDDGTQTEQLTFAIDAIWNF